MSIFQALVLGLVQGLTEFIPVSSSGHLILAHRMLGTTGSSLAFDVALHVGTLLALILFFRNDIWRLITNITSKNKDGRQARLLILATIPAALAGLLFGDAIDEKLRTTTVAVITLASVGIIMLIVDKIAKANKQDEVSTKQGMIVGFAQALALVPGVSRSGATITAGLLVGIDRVKAAKFSFLLAIPIIAGSALGIFIKDGDLLNFNGYELYAGMFAAFCSGLFAIKFMLKFIGSVGLKPFAVYRIVLALVVFVFMV